MTPEEPVITEADDLRMMRDQIRWPAWPLLPVKHRRDKDETGFPKLGYLYGNAGGEVTPTVFFGNIFDIITPHGPDASNATSYASLELLVKDWMVD